MKLSSFASLALTVTMAMPAVGCSKTGKERCISTVEDIMDGIKEGAEKIDDPSIENCADAQVALTKIRESLGSTEVCSDVVNQQHVNGAISKMTADFERRCAKFIGKEPMKKAGGEQIAK